MEENTNETALYAQLNEIHEEIEILDKEKEILRHHCDDHIEVRKAVYSNGSKHYVNQCQRCGEQRGGPLGKKVVLEKNNGIEPDPFEYSIKIDRNEKIGLVNEKWQELFSRKNEVIALIHGLSPMIYESSFNQRQEKIEGVKKKLSVYIDELEKELPDFDIKQLLTTEIIKRKKQRHEEKKLKVKRFVSETELKKWFLEHVSEDFDIKEEVPGTHASEGVGVRIDFLLYPKKHLIKAGFVKDYVGVEVKYFKQEEGFTRKTSRGIWQTISYIDSFFDIDDRQVKPKFCLLFSNLSFSDEAGLIKDFGDCSDNEHDQVEWNGMLHLANHARVGIFRINGSRHKFRGWSLKFAGGSYFSKTESDERYNLKNSDIINKVRVGNFS